MQYPSSFSVNVVSPEKPLFSGSAGEALLPGSSGQFGVLPGHMKLASMLIAGEVRLFEQASSEKPMKRFYIHGGFAEVTGSSCTVLAERAVDMSDYTHADVSAKIEALSPATDSAARLDLDFYQGLLKLL